MDKEKVTTEPEENTEDTEASITSKHFTFDKSFQEKILQAMFMDRVWAIQLAEVLKIDYFQYAHLKLVANKYIEYHKKWKEFPSMELLLTMIKEELRHDRFRALKDEVKSFLIRVESKKDLGDLAFVKQRSLEFCKKAALQEALMKSVDLVETQNYEQVVNVVRDALAAGNEQNKGLDLLEDIDARYSQTYRMTCPTGIFELDQRSTLNGGLGRGEIGFVVAGTGVGKSHMLVQFGAAALSTGRNVIHYTFELNERIVGIRYDSNLTDIPSIDCHDRKEEIAEFYKNNKSKLGRLIIKHFPTGQASVETLRAHIEKLNNKNFIPDLIIVDYAGIMKSLDGSDLLRLRLKQVCEDLRFLAEDLDIPVWTAIQSNKEGSNSDVVDLTNLAESYGQAHVADFVLGLSRQSATKASGFGNMFISKNRAGIDGVKYHIHMDTAKSKIKVLTDEEAARFRDEERDDARSQLLDKFKKLQGN